MLEQLHSQLVGRGYQSRVVSIDHLGDLEAAVEAPRDQALLDTELYEDCLAELRLQPPQSLPQARSIIAVAVPQPQVRVTFEWEGRQVPCIVPPTYHGFHAGQDAARRTYGQRSCPATWARCSSGGNPDSIRVGKDREPDDPRSLQES